MRLYITEKPNVAKAIAKSLWPHGYESVPKQGFITDKLGTVITWSIGHILRLANPEEYNPEWKGWKMYPIFPKSWKLLPYANTQAQLNVIGKLLSRASEVIHVGDPDREGQLLIDELLYYFNYKGPVNRLMLNALDSTSVQRALQKITDNKIYHNWYIAGLCRQRADWLMGINLTRAYTCCSRKAGWQDTLRVGRVKTPTLALVVKRELEIMSFKSHAYFELEGTFTIESSIPFKARLIPDENIQVDDKNRILDMKQLQGIKVKLSNMPGKITKVIKKQVITNPPLPYSLATLQIAANKRFYLSPKKTLAITQALYDKSLVSYPRSDCQYLPTSQFADAKKIITVLSHLHLLDIAHIYLTQKSTAWNDSKITAHHAIIPTGTVPANLNKDEKDIYDLIAKRYLLQFCLPCKMENVNFELVIEGEIFHGQGNIPSEIGFRAVFSNDDREIHSDEENSLLPENMTVGDVTELKILAILSKKTKAPARFTEGTLIAAMANIWQHISPDNPHREKLKELKGIGTPATRDTIIDELQATKIKGNYVKPFMEKKNKELVPTNLGMTFINLVHSSLIQPDTTAEMEYLLSEITKGKGNMNDFDTKIKESILKNIDFADTIVFPQEPDSLETKCPFCNEGLIVRCYSKKSERHFHVCNNTRCRHPITEKIVYYNDEEGSPVIESCPFDNEILIRMKGKNGFFWSCPQCQKTFNDNHGHPKFKKEVNYARTN